MKIKELIKGSFAVAKAGFEAIASAVWLGVAMVVFNTYARQFGLDIVFKSINNWMLTCAFVSFVFYGVLRVNEIKVKPSQKGK